MNYNNQTTILIIDDETAIRQSYADYLEDLDYRPLTAENGRVGLEIFEREKVDLVMVDLRMPEVDGLEVLERIKEVAPDMPMIVVSGNGVIGDVVEALRLGAWDYLLKPIVDFSVLNHAVTNALEKSRLKRENRRYQQHLEHLVDERTTELKQANDHLSQINKRLRNIMDSTRALSFCTEKEKFESLLLKEFGQHMQASGGGLYLKEEDGLRLVHSLDPDHASNFIPFPLSEGSVFQQAMSQKIPILVEDTTGNNDKDGGRLVFPLADATGENTGILAFHNKISPPFVEQDKEIGMILASYGSEALRAVRATEALHLLNTELEQRVEQRTQELQKSIEVLRKTQQQLIVQEKLASLGTLTAGIAHEMRNPLNFVMNFAQVSKGLTEMINEILEPKKQYFEPEAWKNLKEGVDDLILANSKVEEHGERMVKVTESMLSHAGSETHGSFPTNINLLLEKSLELFSYGLKSRQAQNLSLVITKDFDENLKEILLFSQDVGRVFLNIFNNAYDTLNEKLTTSDSELIPKILVSTKDLGKSVEIKIKDNGMGIPEEKKDKIFEPFYTTKSPGEGTGLGLSISYNIIVKRHTGSLSVNSKEGEFTEFIITFKR